VQAATLAQVPDYLTTKSVPNYNFFDFFQPKFDHYSYFKIYVKYHFFLLWLALLTKVLEK